MGLRSAVVDQPELPELDGIIPSGSRVIWWTSPQYGGLPDGAVYRSKSKITTENFNTDVAIFEVGNSLWTIDLWTDEIIRVHSSAREAPPRELDGRTEHH